ncbi:MAG: DoxX family protein [Chlorobi bacterium]|nr:DoxX family protein [Chlorobiota bacterium]
MTETQNKYLGWIFLIVLGLTGYMIRFIEDYSSSFLAVLIAGIVLAIVYRRKFTASQAHISRVLLGVLFVFSGFVKGVDPIGTEYRIVDYFIAYGTDWAFPMALPLSVIMNAAEFVLGMMLLFNVKIRVTLWLTLLMMVFFTFTTINDALYNPVPDCGCFGSAIIISNWQTFYKNLLILAFLMVAFFAQNKLKPWFSIKLEYALTIIFILGFVFFEVYNIRHLPMVDFREWKVGNRMAQKDKLPLQYFLKYKNTKTGEEKEYLSPDYPYRDSVWMSQWEFVDQRVVDPNPKTTNLMIEDADGNDVTAEIIENPGYQFMLVAYDLSKTDLSKIGEIRDFAVACRKKDYSFIMLTSTLPEEAEAFVEKNHLSFDYYFTDDVSLQAMIRSNPGLVLLKDAVVLGKWHYNDFPGFDEFEKDYVGE